MTVFIRRGGVFTPASVTTATLLRWFQRETGFWQETGRTTPAVSGDTAAVWDDQSGNAAHMTQSVAANEVALTTLGGLLVLDFPGASGTDWFNMGDLSSWTSACMYLRIQFKQDPQGADTGRGLWEIGQAGQNSFWNGSIWDSFGSTARKATGDPSPSMTAWRTYKVRSKANDWTNWIDGTQHFNTGTNTVAFDSAAFFGKNSVPWYLNAYVREVVIFDDLPTGSDDTNMETYMAAT